MNKRGLNEVVTTGLLILLGIAGVVIIWGFFKVFITETSDDIDVSNFAVSFSIEPSSVEIDEGIKFVSFNVKRDAGEGVLSGIKVVLEDSGGASAVFDESAMDELETRRIGLSYAGNGLGDLERISVRPVFSGSGGQANVGQIAEEFEFSETVNYALPAQESGLVGYWSFDEGTGTITKDISGNGIDGTFFGNPTWVPGRIGNALNFSFNNYVDIGIHPLLNNNIGNFSIAAWSKLEISLGANNVNYHIFDNEFYRNYGYMFRIEDTNNLATYGKIAFRTSQAGADTQVTSTSLSYPNDLGWHHLIAIKEGNVGRIYLDGVEIVSGAMNNPVDSPGSNKLGLVGTASAGKIFDEVRVYNRALSQEEITALASYTG